ncbi:MAG: hypothetical protein AAF368_06490, partial [Planctomycetota bacterium]
RLWGVSVLAQLDSPDTVALAVRALEGVVVDEFLDFAVWSICREHADRWTDEVISGDNPFENAEQLLTALSALNRPIGVNQMLEAIRADGFETEASTTKAIALVGKVGTPAELEKLFDLAIGEAVEEDRREAIVGALEDAAGLRKLQPTGDKDRLLPFLESPNVATFTSAVRLAGRWKLESSRPRLESTFLNATADRGRAEAALDGLVALGGSSTATFLEKLAQDENADFTTRSLAVVGRTRMGADAGAQLALAVLEDEPAGRDLDRIFDAFLATKQGPGALAEALSDQTLSQPIALAGMQKASSAATKPDALVAALQKAGGLKPMKMALSPEEMESMMARVASEGDPHRGESIYRRAALQCVVCHAIGGAGGIIGPDLVSIGASAPVDYLIDSMLQPSVKIKEGYHTVLITMKDGSAHAGAIAREDANEIVIRDAAGNENRLPKADVASNEISPVSLMPPGLTASLREDEFVDLIAFLSELGKDGDFKTPTNRFVRQWQMLMPHERTRDAIGHHGEAIFAEEIESYVWWPIYATVGGKVPVGETPDLVGRGRSRYAAARTFVDVAEVGEIRLRLAGKLKDLHFFHGETEIPLPEKGRDAEVVLQVDEPGRQRLTVAGLKGYGLDEVSLELLDDSGKVGLVEVKDF